MMPLVAPAHRRPPERFVDQLALHRTDRVPRVGPDARNAGRGAV